jgi:hypothetical protein
MKVEIQRRILFKAVVLISLICGKRTDSCLALRLRMLRAIPLLPLCACMECYGETFTFTCQKQG